MQLFSGTLLIVLICCLAMGLGLLLTGKPLAGGCRSGMPGKPRCSGCPKPPAGDCPRRQEATPQEHE